MIQASSKELVKSILGYMPLTAELYWLLRQRGKDPIKSRFSLKQLNAHLPQICEEVRAARNARAAASPEVGRKVFLFASLHYWIEHAAIVGLALAGQGHQVALGFLPYSDWRTPDNRFDTRRQNAYARKVFEQASSLMEIVPFYGMHSHIKVLPEELQAEVERVATYDAQYTLQVEDVEPKNETYKLRIERDQEAALAALTYLRAHRPDVVIVPNGTIQEMGVVYRVARYLHIPVVTYEFGDERQHIWLAQDDEVMRQNTDLLWEVARNKPLNVDQSERVHAFFSARHRGDRWENFVRRWQDSPTLGGEEIRQTLNLDNRPVVLLATNVLGDSLTLGRQLFSRTMAEWIARTVQYFAGCNDAQLLIRIHPGEVLTHGLAVEDVVRNVLPVLPQHIHLVGPSEKINTYDIVEIADLGLVYTTTVGMEMAMGGCPVIVSGQTHYRNRGFTHDPDSWRTYFKMLKDILEDPAKFRLTDEQMDLAWRYAYYFFFEFPRPFPWHLVRLWDDYQELSMADVLNKTGLAQFGQTFRHLSGETLDWAQMFRE